MNKLNKLKKKKKQTTTQNHPRVVSVNGHVKYIARFVLKYPHHRIFPIYFALLNSLTYLAKAWLLCS